MKFIKKILFISLIAAGVAAAMKKLRGKPEEPAWDHGEHDHTGHDHAEHYPGPTSTETPPQDTNP